MGCVLQVTADLSLSDSLGLMELDRLVFKSVIALSAVMVVWCLYGSLKDLTASLKFVQVM